MELDVICGTVGLSDRGIARHGWTSQPWHMEANLTLKSYNKTIAMDIKSDEILVRETISGRPEAFAELVQRYQDYGYALAVGKVSDFELARDVVQEAFLLAYQDLGRLRDPCRFAGWFGQIVRHTASNVLRELSRARSLTAKLSQDTPPEGTASPADRWAEDKEESGNVRRALERLNEKNREAVCLYYVDGLSYTDIAGLLEVSKATVLGRLQRARIQLREELTMVEKAFKHEGLPEDFSEEIQRLLDEAAVRGRDRERTVGRLVQMGGSAVDFLCRALSDRRVAVKMVAARALCRIGDTRAIGPLLGVLRDGDYWMVNEIIRTGRILAIPGVREELLEIVREGKPDEQYWALIALSHAGEDQQVFETVLEKFRDQKHTEVKVRCSAMVALFDLKPECRKDWVMEALNDAEIRRRSGWAWAGALREGFLFPIEVCRKGFTREIASNSRLMAGWLILRHGEAGKKVLEEILQTGPDDERAAAAVALGSAGHPNVFSVLVSELLAGRSERKWARIMSRILVDHYSRELIAWSEGGHSELRRCCDLAWALARAQVKEGTAMTEGVLDYGTPAVRAVEVRKISREKGMDIFPELRRFLREVRPRKVAQEAFWQVYRLGEKAIPAVGDMFHSEHWGERKAAVCLLRRWKKLTSDQKSRALKDPHPAVRHAAEWHPVYRKAARGWHPKWHKRLEEND